MAGDGQGAAVNTSQECHPDQPADRPAVDTLAHDRAQRGPRIVDQQVTRRRFVSARPAYWMWTHLATEGTLSLSTAHMRYQPGA